MIGPILAALLIGLPIAASAASVHLEELTWIEASDALKAGTTTVIIPTGGVEQNGPHMVLGKHNYVVRHAAGRIAEVLGNALVAPVVAYVPEGDVDPPTGHMAFAGTISVPPRVFAEVLEHAARSLRAHGFRTICFVGDSFDNQAPQAEVAARLSRDWAGSGAVAIHVGDYYAANGQVEWLMARGEGRAAIGNHAGIRDTSELLAVFPLGIRDDLVRRGGGFRLGPTGVDGDPTRATAERGRRLLDLKIEAAVAQIRASRDRR